MIFWHHHFSLTHPKFLDWNNKCMVIHYWEGQWEGDKVKSSISASVTFEMLTGHSSRDAKCSYKEWVRDRRSLIWGSLKYKLYLHLGLDRPAWEKWRRELIQGTRNDDAWPFRIKTNECWAVTFFTILFSYLGSFYSIFFFNHKQV